MRSILIIEDDPLVRKTLVSQLGKKGFDVSVAETGEDGVRAFGESPPDVVLLDVRLPDIDGLEVLRRIKERSRRAVILVMTAFDDMKTTVEAIKLGAFEYLVKPLNATELDLTIDKAFQVRSLEEKVSYLIEERKKEYTIDNIIGHSAGMRGVFKLIGSVANTRTNILIQGESGTGKELVAKAIHYNSPYRDEPFIVINCSAIQDTLLESELFGHVKGAFTGAGRDHPGLFLSAEGGTVFLDEIGDMPAPLQVKLLRVLQEGEVRPVGATETRPVDVRILSATHRNLEEAIASGEFREDLYYRLNVVNLTLPPLRERREDIPLLAQHFLAELTEKYQRRIHGFAPDALDTLTAADWPGNIRQLHNVLEQCVALCTTSTIPASLVARALRDKPAEIQPLAEARAAFERDYLITLLKLTRGQVSEVARLAGRNRTEVYRLLQRHDLTPALFKDRDETD